MMWGLTVISLSQKMDKWSSGIWGNSKVRLPAWLSSLHSVHTVCEVYMCNKKERRDGFQLWRNTLRAKTEQMSSFSHLMRFSVSGVSNVDSKRFLSQWHFLWHMKRSDWEKLKALEKSSWVDCYKASYLPLCLCWGAVRYKPTWHSGELWTKARKWG